MGYGEELRAELPAGGFGQTLYVYESIGSTNSRAAELAQAGASQGTLVVADHQTEGRGRAGRRWDSAPGTGVAMSLILRPTAPPGLRWSGLGALAVIEALNGEGLHSLIKWPNDVVVGGRKLAGVLVEAAWEGTQVVYVILGIGINVGARSVPPAESLAFPATTVEDEARRPLPRPRLIAGVLRSLETWSARIDSETFLEAWEGALAFKREAVLVETDGGSIRGKLVGLGPDGEARIEVTPGETVLVRGDARSLRLVTHLMESGRERPLPSR